MVHEKVRNITKLWAKPLLLDTKFNTPRKWCGRNESGTK